MQNNHVAVIDIGSNSVRMVIFDTVHKVPVPIFNEKVFCALGRDLDKTKRLNKDGVKTALLALNAFVLLAQAKQVKKIIAVGTAALRDATDSKKFIETVYKQTKLKIKIIKGEDEAYYAALGVMGLDKNAAGLVADFGGGSLEIAKITRGKISSGVSFPFGAYRVLPLGNAAYAHIYNHLKTNYKNTATKKNLYIIGGSWRALLQAYFIQTKQKNARLQGFTIHKQDMLNFCKTIENWSPSKIAKIFHLEMHRAHLLPISSVVLRATIEAMNVETIIVSTAGIRDGIICEYMKAA